MSRTSSLSPQATREAPETCVLVGVDLRQPYGEALDLAPRYTAEESLDELAELAAGAGARVLGSSLQARDKADPALLIGSGKADEIKAWAAEVEADFVLFDQSLTPTQQRNLEKTLDRRVLDRTQLILDVFARHARTREGQLQVELAQLSYLLPRLTGRGAAMSRLGAGIGTRGPGETKLETDRRRISKRIERLEDELERVRRTRTLQRQKRVAVPLSTVALAGYTNAGKSTLFNKLTQAGVLADKKMFATLDPTIRQIELPSKRRVLLSDTVGFIRNLPTTLVKAFRATLEEVVEAAMILHVVDVSSPHYREQIAEVDRILGELEVADKPQILVLNKADRVEPDEAEAAAVLERGSTERAAVVVISSKTGAGLDELARRIEEGLPADPVERVRYRFPFEAGDVLSFLYRHARVIERNDCEDGVEILADAAESVRRRLEQYQSEI